jgi:hypothetical protein
LLDRQDQQSQNDQYARVGVPGPKEGLLQAVGCDPAPGDAQQERSTVGDRDDGVSTTTPAMIW